MYFVMNAINKRFQNEPRPTPSLPLAIVTLKTSNVYAFTTSLMQKMIPETSMHVFVRYLTSLTALTMNNCTNMLYRPLLSTTLVFQESFITAVIMI